MTAEDAQPIQPTPAPSALPAAPAPDGLLRPGPARRDEAIEALLRGDRAAARRFLRFAEESRLAIGGLWSRVAPDGRIRETVLATVNPGRTATLFASSVRRTTDIAPIAGLLAVACRELAPLDVAIGQAMADPRETLQVEAFERSGMRRLATLSYLERARSGPLSPQDEPWPEDVAVERWEPQRRRELEELLERTYVDTLDCPMLAGIRRREDILEGHLRSGRHEPSLWTILRFAGGPRAGTAIGCCLMNSSPPSAVAGDGSIELVYLGLAPEARGRGLARHLLRHAWSLLAPRGERTVALAVDERNGPALALYRRAGFRPTLRRIAFIHQVRRSPAEVG